MKLKGPKGLCNGDLTIIESSGQLTLNMWFDTSKGLTAATCGLVPWLLACVIVTLRSMFLTDGTKGGRSVHVR